MTLDVTATVAEHRIENFLDRFEPTEQKAYQRLLHYAALPLVLTAELLHYLRIRFVRDAPWVAEADILLDETLCSLRTNEQYIMQPFIRNYLIEDGRAKIDIVNAAWLLIRYVEFIQQNSTYANDDADLQKMAALAYIPEKRELVAEHLVDQLDEALKKTEGTEANRNLVIRQVEKVAYLTQLVAPELKDYAQYQGLLEFARRIGKLQADVNGTTLHSMQTTGEAFSVLTFGDRTLPSIAEIYGIGTHNRRVGLDVLLSTSIRDLPVHHESVKEAVWRTGNFVSEIEYPTSDDEVINTIHTHLAEIEVYICVLGYRYGYIPNSSDNPQQLSLTELEYRYAIELGIPMLIFIMSKSHPVPDIANTTAKEAKSVTDTFYASDTINMRKLESFKNHLSSNNIVGFFDSPEDLKQKILQGLNERHLREAAITNMQKRREGLVQQPQIHETFTAPIPFPPHIYAHSPYVLDSNKFVGRQREAAMLTEWAHPSNDAPILVLTSIGGAGKSALSWKWMHDNASAFEGVFWYSFYESTATMRDCVRHALAYVSQRDPKDLENQPYRDLSSKLITILRRRRFLIVFDGLERILLAYHRANIPRISDSDDFPQINSRASIDQLDDAFLRDLTSCEPSRILITSRLLPLAFQHTTTGDLLSSVQQIEILGLSNDAIVELLQTYGITWENTGVLTEFVNQFGGNSLLVKVLAGIIKSSKRAQGNFDIWYEIHGESFNTLNAIQQIRAHILEVAYNNLSLEARKLLSQMAAFTNAPNYDLLSIFNPYLPPKPKVLEQPQPVPEVENYEAELIVYQQAKAEYEKSSEYTKAVALFDALLTDLEERGLITWDRQDNRYHMHPVVRGFAYSQLEKQAILQIQENIADYFHQQGTTATATEIKDISDLKSYIELYRALIGAGKNDEAAVLYGERLHEDLVIELENYTIAEELLMPLFPNGLSELPAVNTEEMQRQIHHWMIQVQSLRDSNATIDLQDSGTKLKTDTDSPLIRAPSLPNRTENFVFISHSSKDNDNVRTLAQDLRANGINVWVDFEAVEDGARWLQSVEQALINCDAAVIVMSPGARESEWVEREALMLLDLRKPIFIAMIEPTPLPLHLITQPFTDFVSDYDKGFRSLTHRLHDVLNSVPEAVADATPNPDNNLSPDPTEDNFFAYMAQMKDGEAMSLIAQDLYYWAKKETDSIVFGGRHSPCFHARVIVGDKEVTVFSVQAYLRDPAVTIPFDYLSKYAPYTDQKERVKVLRQLDYILPSGQVFNETRANRRPSFSLSYFLNDSQRLERFKSIISEIISRLHNIARDTGDSV